MSNTTELPDASLYFDLSQMNIISVISLLTAGLSLTGCASILICVGYHKRVCATEIFPIFHLSLADGLASILMIVLSALFLDTTRHSYPGSSGPCGYVFALMTGLYICTFFLTLGYALEAFVRLRQRLQTYLSLEGSTTHGVSSYCMYVIYFLSWIVPLALGIFLTLETHFIPKNNSTLIYILPTQCSLCFPIFSLHERLCWSHVDHGYQKLLMYKLIFLIPLICVFILNMVLYICIARDFRHVSMRRGLLSYHQRQEESMLRKKACLYQFAFIICWIPTLIGEFASFSESYSMADYYALFILQALLGPIQGFLNCLIYGWKRDSFRRALTESSPLMSSQRGTMSFTL